MAALGYPTSSGLRRQFLAITCLWTVSGLPVARLWAAAGTTVTTGTCHGLTFSGTDSLARLPLPSRPSTVTFCDFLVLACLLTC